MRDQDFISQYYVLITLLIIRYVVVVITNVHCNAAIDYLCLFRLFGSSSKDQLPLADFLIAVGQLKFRGTSVLLRLPKSCMANFKK